MTIKHTKKDIGSESGKIVTGIATTAATITNENTDNYSSDLVIKLKKQDQYNEIAEGETNAGRDLAAATSSSSSDKITIPLSKLVTQAYLSTNYYTKDQVDAQVKPHFVVLNSINNLPSASSVRTAGHQNYIYLVPFTGTDYETDNNSETIQEGHFEEYMYVIDGTDTSTERMEKIGSTKIDLSPYVKTTELNSAVSSALSGYIVDNLTTNDSTKVLSAKQGKILNDGKANSTHNHGNLNSNGTIGSNTASGRIVLTTTDGALTTVSQITDSKIKVPTSYSAINNNQNDSLADVLTNVNSCISNLNTATASLGDYLLKSKIHEEIWGQNQNGFYSMQLAEANNSPSKQYKLGDYIYNKVYTKSDIDTLIGTLAQLQQQTLNIL